MQSRPAVVLWPILVCASLAEKAHNIYVAAPGSHVQRCSAVLGCLVPVRAGFYKEAHDLSVPIQRSHVHGRPSIRIRIVGICQGLESTLRAAHVSILRCIQERHTHLWVVRDNHQCDGDRGISPLQEIYQWTVVAQDARLEHKLLRDHRDGADFLDVGLERPASGREWHPDRGETLAGDADDVHRDLLLLLLEKQRTLGWCAKA
mmetsp:Transcript_17923/g.40502  ORF Transcript_17923/g.40502 Transcript_17923/m.40502 type:complete len:204 (-) Transcript_17923:170-781(-)